AAYTRSFLQARGADYLSAQLTGTPSTFLTHAAQNFTYIENNTPTSSNITLTYLLKIDYNYTIYDTARCATFSELVSASDPHPYIIHTRVEYAASVTIPWGLPCSRIEGGLYANGTFNTTTGNCEQSLPSTIIVPYRWYVVDEEAGVVDMFVGFPGLDRTQGKAPMPDSHLIRVEGGKIKYMHTWSSCVVPGCG
ncbi:hypothetical protein BU23DRAFT_440305, partial [Bimuria novae-zelandiae CBS 107.79]